MKKILCQAIGLLPVFLVLLNIACEKVHFPEPEGNEGNPLPDDTLVVDTTGEGSMYSPATVTDLLLREAEFMGTSCWVAGYIVGYTERTMKNAAFTTDGAVQSNILLADSPDEQDEDYCVPVELKTEKWKTTLSLAHRPENLGQRVVVHGMIKTYFSVTGVRAIDGSYWLENESDPGQPQEPQEPEEPQEPQDPEEPNQPDNPEEPDDSEEDPGTPYLIYINETLLQLVQGNSALQVGGRYMLGTVPDLYGATFVAASWKYGPEVKYRQVLSAERSGDHLITEQGVAPAVFVLQQEGQNYRFRDELTGGLLAYDVRGDVSSTSWLPLYTLPEEDLDNHFYADFLIDADNAEEQLRTAEMVKYSSVLNLHCLLRYNSGGKNFKLNYGKNGKAVCLFLLK